MTLSPLSALSLLDTSSSDSRTEEQGEEPSTSSNFLFKIPLIAAALSHVPGTEQEQQRILIFDHRLHGRGFQIALGSCDFLNDIYHTIIAMQKLYFS